MKLPNWLKIIWWLILFGFVTYMMSLRFNSIISGSSNTTDIIIFLIWIALFAIPLFREVSFFGVGLKKEIDNLKSELSSFKSEIRNTMSMRAEISPQIQFLTPPTDSELQDLKKDFKSILEQIKERGLEKPTSKLEIPDDVQFLFSTRYKIESELRRIWKRQWASAVEIGLWTGQVVEELERPESAFQIIRSLSELGIITPRFSSLVREVYRVCSPVIHGEKVSQTAMSFVRDVAPGLITSLEAIPKETKTNKE